MTGVGNLELPEGPGWRAVLAPALPVPRQQFSRPITRCDLGLDVGSVRGN